MHILYSLIL